MLNYFCIKIFCEALDIFYVSNVLCRYNLIFIYKKTEIFAALMISFI